MRWSVAYQTAYLKAHYPVEFLAASMTLDMGNTDKLSEFRARGASGSASRCEAPNDQPFRRPPSRCMSANAIYYALGRA